MSAFPLQRVHQKGFSLIEILVSIFVLSIVLFAATTLVISVMNANRANLHRLTATHLAEEGVEAVRNIRDSYWRQSLDWTGDVNVNVFGSVFANGDYIVDRHVPEVFENSGADTTQSVRLGAVISARTWNLKEKKSEDDARLFLQKMGETFLFVHDFHREPSPFSRTIHLELQPFVLDGTSYEKLFIVSTVTWNEGSVSQKVSLSTFLTDWKYAQ